MINQKHNLIVWIFGGIFQTVKFSTNHRHRMGQFQMLFGPLEFRLRFRLSFFSPFFPFLLLSLPFLVPRSVVLVLPAFLFAFCPCFCFFLPFRLQGSEKRKKEKEKKIFGTKARSFTFLLLTFHPIRSFLITYFSTYSFLSYYLLFISFFLITYLTYHSFLS